MMFIINLLSNFTNNYSRSQAQKQMEQIKSRNLYFPVLNINRHAENSSVNKSITVNRNNDINDVLKLIQNKKTQLQSKNHENQQSESQSDNEQQTNYEQNQYGNLKYKTPLISVLQNARNIQRQKFHTVFDQKVQKQDPNISSMVKNRNMRIKTQVNHNHSKSTNNYSKIKQKKIIKVQSAKPLVKYLRPKQMSRQLGKLVPAIPLKIKQRNQATLKDVVTFLQDNNPFFMKLDRIVVTCLLKVCNIVRKQKREVIYERQSIYGKFFIILSGKVKLSNQSIELKKLCVPGETLLQEAWVNLNEQKRTIESLEKARSVGQSYLLQIHMQKFKKVKQELTKFGFKTQYNQLEALIKRNYIVKNSIRIEKNKF